MPPRTQTPTMSSGVSTCRATSAGVTKMPEPMIPPMTSMVASNRPRRRASPRDSTRASLTERRSRPASNRDPPACRRGSAPRQALRGRRSSGFPRGATGSAARAGRGTCTSWSPATVPPRSEAKPIAPSSRFRPVPSRPRSAFSAVPRPRAAASPSMQRRAGRRIGLVAMVGLGDFDVPLGPEHARRALDELGKQGNAERGVRRSQDRHIFRRSRQSCRPPAASSPVVPTRIGMPAETARSRLAWSAVGRGEIDEHVAVILVDCRSAGLRSPQPRSPGPCGRWARTG